MAFTYFDGTSEIKVDPLIIYDKILQNKEEIYISSAIARSKSQSNKKAQECLVKNIRDIFNIKPLVEGGLMDIEVIGLLNHFLIVYMVTIRSRNSN